jgi:hypothetical protein
MRLKNAPDKILNLGKLLNLTFEKTKILYLAQQIITLKLNV